MKLCEKYILVSFMCECIFRYTYYVYVFKENIIFHNDIDKYVL